MWSKCLINSIPYQKVKFKLQMITTNLSHLKCFLFIYILVFILEIIFNLIKNIFRNLLILILF